MSIRAGVRVLSGTAVCGLLAACSTGAVSDVKPTSATLHGVVESRDQPASYVFQYAPRTADLGTAAGATTPRRQLAANTASHEIAEPVGGLAPATSYAYRLCGRISGGAADGCLGTRRFTTPPEGSQSITFDEPGVHTFTVPAGVTSLGVLAVGAGGGDGFDPAASYKAGKPVASPGGLGGSVQMTMEATPGETVEVRVGGTGGDANTVGAIYPGAGGKGGSNGVDVGGNGGSGTGHPAPGLASTSGGGGGGAPTVVRKAFYGDVESWAIAGGGGGAGDRGDAGLPALGGNGGDPGGRGGDGNRSDPRNPYSLGGGIGRGGIGNGQDPDLTGYSGGNGGSDTRPDPLFTSGSTFPFFSCGTEVYSGGGGGGGGWLPAGGGGSGRFRIIAEQFGLCADLHTTLDGASGGGGGSNYALDSYPTFGNGVEPGDGYATLTWVRTPEN